jgi:beta-lactamase class A
MKSNILSIILLVISSSVYSQIENLQSKIDQIAKSKKANVGFALLGIEDADSLALNGQSHYPMQSVFKFHLALDVLDKVDKGKLKLDQDIFIKKDDLASDTWSPLRDKHPNGNVNLKLSKIISYTVSQSDNNGCDILFKLVGGTDSVNHFIHKLGINEVSIVANEEQMHKGWDVQFKNWTTPLASAQLLKKFYQKKVISESSTKFLLKILLETTTGLNRIKGQLPQGTEVAHKTGSSGSNDQGITAAFNDIGIVTLPNGKHYAIAVFITDSKEDDEVNAEIIALLSKAVWDYLIIRK